MDNGKIVYLASKQQIPNNLDLKNMKDSNNIVYNRTINPLGFVNWRTLFLGGECVTGPI